MEENKLYFDTHAHYTDEAFDTDREDVIQSLIDGDVDLVVNSSCDLESSVKAMELSEKYSFIYATVGWHPHDAKTYDESSADKIRDWCMKPKVKAIGEIGLDYYYDLSERSVQIDVFERQMELARELDMPVVIHDREAHEDCMQIIRKFPDVRGAFHCYSGSAEMAKEIIDRGWYFGFTGAITFKKARLAIETIQICPLDKIMIETDCPYLTPEPYRGKRNNSTYLPYMADKIAQIKGISREKVANLTMENGKRFFSIK